MPIKVLVVDDSSFFRRRVSEIIESDRELEVVGTANDGKDAIEKTKLLRPDVITMDVEMPVMDGITAVREIMAAAPTNILMFSSLTHDGAKSTLDALDAGALDFLPKKFEDIARNRDDAVTLLLSRIKQIARKPSSGRRRTSSPATDVRSKPAVTSTSRSASSISQAPSKSSAFIKKPCSIVAIGTSTGGPVALQTILSKLPANFPHPIVLVQHMPAAFTPAFAGRLNQCCKIQVKEAQQGDLLKPGQAYLAPGGCQMLLEGSKSQAKIRIINDESDRLTYKPSVDVTFGSIAKLYRGEVLAMILTGMGADGKEGSRMLKSAGSVIWSQDEASCVVYGMPQAVDKAGISSLSLPLDSFSAKIMKYVG